MQNLKCVLQTATAGAIRTFKARKWHDKTWKIWKIIERLFHQKDWYLGEYREIKQSGDVILVKDALN